TTCCAKQAGKEMEGKITHPRGDCPRGHCPRGDYLLEAARQLRLALERDVSEDYEEAFAHYQNADPNKERGEAVKRKIAQYLRRAEEIFTCHLQRGLGDGSPTGTGYSSLRLRPIRTLSAAVENLRRCKVVGVIDKSLPKSHVETRERQTIIPHGVPFMVKLLCYYASEDSIFLHLEHVQGERGQHCLLARSILLLSILQDQIAGDVLSGQAMACAQEDCVCGVGPGALSAPPLFLLRFPGETLWSHLRAKYRAQQGPPHGSGSLHSKAAPAPRPRSREDAEGSIPGSSHGPMDPAPLLPSSSGRQQLEPALQEPSLTHGRSAASWGLRRAPGSWGHGRRAWAVKEEQVRLWAAEILLALEGLHQQGVLCRDLNPRNLLLDTAGRCTGQLRAAELCLRSVGLLFFPCLYLCPQGLLEPVHPFEPWAPLAAQAE
uniref:Protein kinase domain-containing protein n=1 Tax=Anas zonorhyncha TaxID=75864 RepID=A0A8B9ZNZ0_9AVES